MARVKSCLSVLLLFLAEGLSQLVRTQQVVTATLGEDAHFSCRLMRPKDVLQVTWQKVTPGAIENVATYNKRFGPVVNPPFQRNVEFEDEGLQNCSIIIRGVSRGDEAATSVCLTPIQMELSVAGPVSKLMSCMDPHSSSHKPTTVTPLCPVLLLDDLLL
ncbi:hypothetical protein J4Q44_G00049900 [Coregonus suidteri]|uniref:Ig-like domain-containing protein n=1 Tax=Coregonus suidteri TaxID=861788 RepID=A0AAN8M799_9TELE